MERSCGRGIRSQPFVEHLVDAPGPQLDGHDQLGFEVGEFTLPAPHLGELAQRVTPDGLERTEIGIDGRHGPGRRLTHGVLLWGLLGERPPAVPGRPPSMPGLRGDGADDPLLTPDRKADATRPDVFMTRGRRLRDDLGHGATALGALQRLEGQANSEEPKRRRT
ncbi:hypothetical protein [Geodermatophilus sp. SYSU D01176]